MDRNQTGNILIGAGVLAGLGTLAYWLMSGGMEGITGGAGDQSASAARPGLRPAITAATALPAFTAQTVRPSIQPSARELRTF